MPELRPLVALLCTALLVPGEGVAFAQAPPAPAAAAPAAPAEKAPPPIPPAQLDSLVAPIALYSDPLLAQVLVASTYPLEIIQLQQWLLKNKGLKDKALTDAVAKQPWDPAIQSMAAFPDAVKRLADDISWTTDLGNAFLAQQNDVMDAVQRMRKKALDKGALKTNEQQKVETKVVESQTVIVVQPANPQVIYVPVYSPTVVYPPPVYPYPPIYYPPPPPPGAAFMTFTAGVMIGAAFSNGSCCNCGWGHGSSNVNINVNNNYYKNTNINNVSGNNSWQHNSAHRGGTPYPNSTTANKYSRTASSPSASGRQASPQQQAARPGGAGASPSASTQTAGRSGAGAGASPSASAAGAGGASKGSGAFGGGSGGFNGASANASSARGASSMGSRSGGGASGGGGGGGRSGGGRKR